MKAFVLCAGLGTRLRPLTYRMPKALLPVWGKSGIFHIINHLKTIDVEDIIINAHHLSYMLKTALGNRVKYSYEKRLLDTGGGLKKVEYFLKDDTFIVYNCDVITNVNLKKMLEFHKKKKNYITLLASKKHKPKAIIADKKGEVIRIGNGVKGNYAFCGIHIVEPFIFNYIIRNMRISIIRVYSNLIKEDIPINIFPLGKAFWQEIGNTESYKNINILCQRNILNI